MLPWALAKLFSCGQGTGFLLALNLVSSLRVSLPARLISTSWESQFDTEKQATPFLSPSVSLSLPHYVLNIL